MSGAPWSAAFRSERGRGRDENQDASAILPDVGLVIVADGMGGHRGGAFASKAVVATFPVSWSERRPRLGSDARRIANALSETVVATGQMLRTSVVADPELAGLGTALVIALLERGRAHVVSMGDCRAYRMRDRKLTRLTEDHSVVELLVKHGHIAESEARDHPARGQLSRYVGMEAPGLPDVRQIALHRSDRMLLCTDGLSGVATDQEIATALRTPTRERACDALVELARRRGSRDDITVLVLDWHGQQAVRRRKSRAS